MLISRARRILWSSAIGLGAAISFCLWALPLPAQPLTGIAVSTLGLELLLTLAALSIASAGVEPVVTRLGLARSDLPTRVTWVAVAGTLALSHAVDGILSLGGLHERSVLADLNALLTRAGPSSILAAMVGMGIAPAIGEEIFCRGLVQRGLTPRMGGPAAVICSALAFGALHLEWIQGGGAVVLGLYLGSLTHLTGSIRPAITCHAVNNLVAIALGWANVGSASSPESTIPVALFIATIAMAVVVRSTRIRRRVAPSSAIRAPEQPPDIPEFGP